MVNSIAIYVAYADEHDQRCVRINVPEGTTIGSAIERSRILHLFTTIDLNKNRVGIFGQLRALDDIVEDGDRVEIYRPLKIDPKEKRRRDADVDKPE